jgi:DNA processing protein
LKFAYSFVKKGVTIVSGITKNINTLAYITALENKSQIIAVLGKIDFSVKYPPENKKL